MRIAVIGLGRMGESVIAEAERRGHQVVARIGEADNVNGAGLSAPTLNGAEVAIEFTQPGAVVANLHRLIELGIPVVTGTTGWREELPALEALVAARRGALLHAANFSIGAHLMFRAARELGRALADRPEFDAAIFEPHHRRKPDSPSGTGLALQAAVRAGDPSRPYPITSERLGSIPGLHRLEIDGEHETLTLTHSARNRAVFAVGAVKAAEWLPGKIGIYQFEHVLFGDER